jgi:hypothetical protein
MMTRLLGAITASILSLGLVSTRADDEPESPKSVPTTADFQSIRNEVETLRGKKFQREVPVTEISEQELREMCDRELEKLYPGQKLANYEELLAWFDMVPPHSDLKSIYATFMIDQLAGLYDSDTKKMCIPSFTRETTNRANASEKKMEKLSPSLDDIVLAHEFTHALEDQSWPIDDPKDQEENMSTDRGAAHGFLVEGSATRLMIEAVPAQSARGSASTYFIMWNLLHSDLGEFVLKYVLLDAWKGSDALVEGVPETLSRTEAMPYSFGYLFCTEIMQKWGLDGLDYIYDHRPISSEQVMHPQKAWEWRDFPVQVNIPETLPGGWKQISHDSSGEAGVAILLGCQLKNLNRGLQLASGWDGDRAALFEGANGKRLMIWASSWDSAEAARRCARACVKERRIAHQATVTTTGANRSIQWDRPDGRHGLIMRQGKHLIVLETDSPEGLGQATEIADVITFAEPPEDAARSALNSPLRRLNPLLSQQLDGDYHVTRSFCGILSRHDRNSVGAADSFLLGLLAESRRTTSFNRWEFGGGWIARHESEARRGVSHTTLLPWGLLASHSSYRPRQSPHKTITRSSLIWGLGGSITADESQTRAVRLLPFGLLFRGVTGPSQTSIHAIGTGFSRKKAADNSSATTRFRLFGVPIWTTHSK